MTARKTMSSLAAPLVLSSLLIITLFSGCTRREQVAPTAVPAKMSHHLPGAEGLDGSRHAPSSTGGFASSDEIWVIARHDAMADTREDVPRSDFGLRARLRGSEEQLAVPLEHTDVAARVHGSIASVRVTQNYVNPYDQKIEAIYVFPLPHDSAVSDFVMTVGDRRIRGIVREREEAERVYMEARSQGYVASLLTQERPNIFTQKVANIEPGKRIDVELQYFGSLPWRDGAYEFSFPMVVGPRYNPAGSRDGVAALPRGRSADSTQRTTVTYLAPDESTGHDLSLSVDLDAGVEIEEVRSHTHVIDSEYLSASHRRISLREGSVLPDKDFVLRWRVAGDTVRTAMLSHHEGGESYFTLTMVPPAELQDVPREAMEFVFVIDYSGSMSGAPLKAAKAAVKRVLARLTPSDSFQIIAFAGSASSLAARPLPATPGNVRRGLKHLRDLKGGGGTEMLAGIRAALDYPQDPQRQRLVSFMTDGFIGNEADILAAIHERLGDSRIFSFGVGTSVNRYLLESMAKLGKGAVAYVGYDGEASAAAVDKFYERIAHPALTDVYVDWHGMAVDGVYPSEASDLYLGRPVVLTGRVRGHVLGEVTIHGRIGGAPVKLEVRDERTRSAKRPALAKIWARARIAELSERAIVTGESLREEIEETALTFGLVSDYTAFLAVDTSARTSGDHGVTVRQPVPVPEGVRYDTTVAREPSGL